MTMVFGTVNVGGASSGTISNAAITASSTILLTTQRDVSETALPFAATANLVGFPRAGEVDWELNTGHDNNVILHYFIYNP